MFEASSFLVQRLEHVLHPLLPTVGTLLLTKHHLMSTGPHTCELQAVTSLQAKAPLALPLLLPQRQNDLNQGHSSLEEEQPITDVVKDV